MKLTNSKNGASEKKPGVKKQITKKKQKEKNKIDVKTVKKMQEFWKNYNVKPNVGTRNNGVEKIVQLDPACTDTALEPSLEKINPHSTRPASPPQPMEEIKFERESLRLKVKITRSGLKDKNSDKD